MEFQKAGIKCISIDWGRVEIAGTVTPKQIQKVGINLLSYGLELLDKKKNILVERIKNVIINIIHHSDTRLKINFSDYLGEKLCRDYTYLANVFSEVEGTTIEQFIILHKIQLVKQLINYDELNLTEISWKLHYSSVAHLSTQFKKVTGITPSQFKQLTSQNKIELENV
ncbi:helix-turn-helix domain-containing protein [Mucilaginibacter sp.]|uniref:helix-turn-helix domain-containing protein n=1 Tax=Mucilaginibacter sp. TaxID=1882438 RepID=UPI00356A559A